MNTIYHTYAVGDDVSSGFNGDWYYSGKVTRITAKFLTTDKGHKYSMKLVRDRVEVNNEYVAVMRQVFRSTHGGTWSLTKGIVEKQNPHF